MTLLSVSHFEFRAVQNENILLIKNDLLFLHTYYYGGRVKSETSTLNKVPT